MPEPIESVSWPSPDFAKLGNNSLFALNYSDAKIRTALRDCHKMSKLLGFVPDNFGPKIGGTNKLELKGELESFVHIVFKNLLKVFFAGNGMMHLYEKTFSIQDLFSMPDDEFDQWLYEIRKQSPLENHWRALLAQSKKSS